jgi:hypothetical protein
VAKDGSASQNATTLQITVNYQPLNPLNFTALTADKASPQPAGTTINFTAATKGGVAPIQYKWWVYTGTAWSLVKNWSTSNIYSWTPTVPGSFKMLVWVRSNGNTVDEPENNAYGVVDFTVTPLSVADTSTSSTVTATTLTAEKFSSQVGSMIFVEPNGKCNGNTPCYSGIQRAINGAVDGAVIKVAHGIYRENISINSAKNITLEGGWTNSFFNRVSDPTLTVIDGDVTGDGMGDGSVLRIEGAPGAAINLTMKGFTLQNGMGEDGGGVYAFAFPSGSINLILEGNVIRNNASTNSAAGIGVYSQDRGANAQATLTNNLIYGNKTAGSGGGVYALSSNSSITTLVLMNNTVSHNSGGVTGDGLLVYADKGSSTEVTVKNSIVWGNRTPSGEDIAIRKNGGTATVTASYSDIGNVAVDNDALGSYINLGKNISKDPLFVDSAAGDYHLSTGSPASDAGTSDGAPAVDFEGQARPRGTGYDIGADERM